MFYSAVHVILENQLTVAWLALEGYVKQNRLLQAMREKWKRETDGTFLLYDVYKHQQLIYS